MVRRRPATLLPAPVCGYDPVITDLHTRKLRYFIAVAEELHFSRAAARLFLAQQALSRQIRELEEELGFPLFIRSTRKVELTAAGEVFLAGARAALDTLDQAAAGALRTSRGVTGTLRLGFYPGAALELTEPLFSEFRARCPDVTVETRESAVQDPSCGLAEGASDVALLRLPLQDNGFECEPLFTEPLVVAVSAAHRLAARSVVSVHDLLDEPVTLSDTADPVYRAFWTLDAHRDGRPPREIVVTHSITEEIQFVAAGAAIAITTAAASRYVPHPSIRFLRIEDAPRSTVALAWRAGEESRLVQQFRECAVEVRDRETQIVTAIESPLLPGSAEASQPPATG